MTDVTDDQFDDTPVDDEVEEVLVASVPPEPLTNHQRAARKRMADQREKMKNELRAELLAELRSTMTVANVVAEVAAEVLEPIDPNAFQPVTFWCTSYIHEPRIKRPGGGGFIHFKGGKYIATTQTDVELIEANLSDIAWREDMPANAPTRPDPATGYDPRSWRAINAFREFSTPIAPEGLGA